MDRRGFVEDLQYVRRALARSGGGNSPPGVFLIWAGIVLVGFPLPDFFPEVALSYWLVAGPVGFVLTAWMGRRHGLRLGQEDARRGVLHLVHWVVMLFIVSVGVSLAVSGAISWASLGPLVLLVAAFGFLTAGVHLDRQFLWPGAMMALGVFFVPLWDGFGWSLAGILLAGGFSMAAFCRGGRSGAIEAS